MFYVYLIQSIPFSDIKYVGFTKHLKQRLETHNSGGSIYTSRHKPWVLVAYFAFVDEKKAIDFEKYLKSQSGRAFAKKRFW